MFFTLLSRSKRTFFTLSILFTGLLILLISYESKGQGCAPVSTMACHQLQVSLPFHLTFNSSITGTIADKNGLGTGFTMVDAYSGTRHSADGTPSNASIIGYEASKLTLTGGRLQILTNKGIASLTNNNQINTLGVKVNSQGKLQVDVALLNPFNGSSFQQAGIWFGLNDKTFVKLVVTGNKVELRKELNDASSGTSGTTNPDQRMTGTITNLDLQTVRLRLIIDPAMNTAEGFYSTDGVNYLNTGAAYNAPALSISGMGLTATTAYAGLFATYRNGTTPVTYSFDDFKVSALTTPQTSNLTIPAIADAFVRNGTNAAINYGLDTALQVKGATTDGHTRNLYLKFPLSSVTNVVSAKLRLYGRNTENTSIITTSVYGVDNDTWRETSLNWSNAPISLSTVLGTFGVNNLGQYHEVDVTSFAKAQFTKDKMISLLVKDVASQNRLLSFNSREHPFYQPELIIATSAPVAASRAQLFVENLDKFPSNDEFVASRIQFPWSRDNVVYNTNHDTLRVRLNNKGMSPLVISSLSLSDEADWKIVTLNSALYDPASMLPLTIASGTFADLQLKFLSPDTMTRVKMILDELSIVSNDDRQPYKTIYLRGIWQRQGEGSKEPTAQEMITAFGFKTRAGFTSTDRDLGASGKPKGDEIISSYFVRADATRPITVRQMGAYHGCCNQSETLRWYQKGNTTALMSVVYHTPEDAQRLLPRRNRNTIYAAAEGSFSPTGAFGFKVGGKDWTDTLLNPERKIGIRVWKAISTSGQLIPNAYIIANDYLGTTATNYDYNDNMYYVTNIRPELGPASASVLTSTPSAIDFTERLLQSTTSFTLTIKNPGQTYAGGVQDPAINILAVRVLGENSAEFTAAMPIKTVLASQEATTLTVSFKPVSEGLKIADLLIYYNNTASPSRVPLYGIAKANGTTVSVPYRIKSGSASNVTVNGKTWVADTPYAFDNLEPYSNAQLTQIIATDDDALYLREQSSNGDKRPFRYEMPIANGKYVVRLHFAEIYWGAPGGGLNGGPGSRVMSVQLENELKLINLDVAQQVGSASAVIKNIPVTVTDGKLNINFSATANRPMVCAIEVYQFAIGGVTLMNNQQLVEADQKSVEVYPNPLRNKFTLSLPAGYVGEFTLQLVNMNGQIYELGKYFQIAGGSSMQVDVSRLHLKPGVYFLRIKAGGSRFDHVKVLLY